MEETHISALTQLHQFLPQDGYQHLRFTGTAAEAVDQITSLGQTRNRIIDAITRVSAPAALIEAIVDFDIARGNTGLLTTTLAAVEVARSVYRNGTGIADRLGQLEQAAAEAHVSLTEMQVEQHVRSSKWLAYDTDRIEHVARIIKERTENAQILFIAVAHGATPPALVMADMLGVAEGDLIPIRGSLNRRSRRDPTPQMSGETIEYIQQQAVGKTVIVLDDDMDSGSTLNMFRNAFTQPGFLPPGTPLGILSVTANPTDPYWPRPQNPFWTSIS